MTATSEFHQTQIRTPNGGIRPISYPAPTENHTQLPPSHTNGVEKDDLGKTASDTAKNQHSHGERSLTIVLKVGSSSLSTAAGDELNLVNIVNLVEVIMSLKKKGHNVILITSGAVSVGCVRMRIDRPKNLITKQAIAAVGQSRLMRIYDNFFGYKQQAVAQVLLSRENLSKQHQYTNAQNTFHELLRLGIVPIVNENDTVAVEELKFGDNDTISALVASLVEADWLFLLTDVDALYTANPRDDPNAKPIHVVHDIEKLDAKIGDAGSSWGTGGMATKIVAARIATTAGVTCGIIRSDLLHNIHEMIAGEAVGTKFVPCSVPIRGKKRWIAHGCAPQGTITIDDGAKDAIMKKKSLFAAGIIDVEKDFHAQSSVIIIDKQGTEIARGMVNYSSDEINQIKGLPSRKYSEKLGYGGPNEVINRENLALTISSAHGPLNHPVMIDGKMSPTTKAKCAVHEQLPPFELLKEYNPGTVHAVAEYRSTADTGGTGVQLVTLQHLDSGITGHGTGTTDSSPAAKYMAEKDLIDQLKAQGVVDPNDAQKLIDDLNGVHLQDKQGSPKLKPKIRREDDSPLPTSVPIKRMSSGVTDNFDIDERKHRDSINNTTQFKAHQEKLLSSPALKSQSPVARILSEHKQQ